MRSNTRPARAPLQWLDTTFADGRGAAWLPDGSLCVADAATGREILSDRAGRYVESSDFFDTRAGTLPRAAQIEVGYAARALLEARATTQVIAGLVGRLPARSPWPDAGNALLFELVRPVLARNTRPPALQRLLADVLRRRVMASRRGRSAPFGRAVLRFRAYMAIAREQANGSTRADAGPDVLDLILDQAGSAAPTAQVLEVYMSFVFAMAGSLGFALAWTLMLAVAEEKTDCEPADLVSEALRLYPVAWLLERRVATAHDILGEAVAPGDRVVVSPYAIQRSPRHWDAPQLFRPERWAGRADRSAWLPFGAGPHVCVAAALTVELVARLLEAILAAGEVRIEPLEAQPNLGAALAPPRFSLTIGRKGAP